MKILKRILALTLLLLLPAAPSFAQSGGQYQLAWSTTSGLTSTVGGAYTLNAQLGGACSTPMSGGNYTLSCALDATQANVYLPLVVR